MLAVVIYSKIGKETSIFAMTVAVKWAWPVGGERALKRCVLFQTNSSKKDQKEN